MLFMGFYKSESELIETKWVKNGWKKKHKTVTCSRVLKIRVACEET